MTALNDPPSVKHCRHLLRRHLQGHGAKLDCHRTRHIVMTRGMTMLKMAAGVQPEGFAKHRTGVVDSSLDGGANTLKTLRNILAFANLLANYFVSP